MFGVKRRIIVAIEEVQLQLISKLLKNRIRNSEFLPVAKKVIEVLKAGKILASSNANRKPISSRKPWRSVTPPISRPANTCGSEVYRTPRIDQGPGNANYPRYLQETVFGTATGLVSVWYDASSEIVLGIVVELNSNLRRLERGTTGGISNVVWDMWRRSRRVLRTRFKMTMALLLGAAVRLLAVQSPLQGCVYCKRKPLRARWRVCAPSPRYT